MSSRPPTLMCPKTNATERYWRFRGYHRGGQGIRYLSVNHAPSLLACCTSVVSPFRCSPIRPPRLRQDNAGQGRGPRMRCIIHQFTHLDIDRKVVWRLEQASPRSLLARSQVATDYHFHRRNRRRLGDKEKRRARSQWNGQSRVGWLNLLVQDYC